MTFDFVKYFHLADTFGPTWHDVMPPACPSFMSWLMMRSDAHGRARVSEASMNGKSAATDGIRTVRMYIVQQRSRWAQLFKQTDHPMRMRTLTPSRADRKPVRMRAAPNVAPSTQDD